MRTNTPLRPELASVCGFVSARRAVRNVRPSSRAVPAEPPARGILAELAAMKGLA